MLRCLKSPVYQLFVQQLVKAAHDSKENIETFGA